MIACLTEKYGYRAHILGAVMQELKQIKPIQNYWGKIFVDFVNTVELVGFEERKGLESELNSVTNLRLTVNLLPDHLKREWVLKYQTWDEKDAFPYLIEFFVK